MRIALDGTFLHDAPTWAPAWRSAYNALARLGGASHDLSVFTNHIRARARPDLDEKIRVVPIRLPRGMLLAAWRAGFLPIERWTGPADIAFSVSYRLPPARARRVVFLHDLSFLTHPQTFPLGRRIDLMNAVPRVVLAADIVVAASNATRKEALTRLGLDPARVRVAYQGVEAGVFTPGAPDEAVLSKWNVSPGFFLCVGTIEPRKNHLALARAYARAGGRKVLGRDLVLAGGRGWIPEEDFRVMADLDPGVRMLGFVPREDLPSLYRAARAFLYPSLAEGFGLPVLEALSSGTPVLTSSVSSLPEVGGPGAVYADPHDEDAIREGIRLLAGEDEAARGERIRAGRAFASSFTWENTARGLFAAFDAARSTFLG